MGTVPVRISVIIPAYNEEGYLASCLQSVAHQTYSPYEIIVVNNNSTDCTAEIASRFSVRIMDEKRKGVSAARNAGARVARGSILVFLDADCIIAPNHLERIDISLTEEACDALGGPYVLLDGGPIIRWLTQNGNYYSWYFKILMALFRLQAFSGGNFAVRKGVFQRLHGFDERLTDPLMNEDLEFAVRLHAFGYTVRFDPSLQVISSFRRMKRSPVTTQPIRLWYTIKYLLRASHDREARTS